MKILIILLLLPFYCFLLLLRLRDLIREKNKNFSPIKIFAQFQN